MKNYDYNLYNCSYRQKDQRLHRFKRYKTPEAEHEKNNWYSSNNNEHEVFYISLWNSLVKSHDLWKSWLYKLKQMKKLPERSVVPLCEQTHFLNVCNEKLCTHCVTITVNLTQEWNLCLCYRTFRSSTRRVFLSWDIPSTMGVKDPEISSMEVCVCGGVSIGWMFRMYSCFWVSHSPETQTQRNWYCKAEHQNVHLQLMLFSDTKELFEQKPGNVFSSIQLSTQHSHYQILILKIISSVLGTLL